MVPFICIFVWNFLYKSQWTTEMVYNVYAKYRQVISRQPNATGQQNAEYVLIIYV